MLKGTEIIYKAKQELKEFITYELNLLYTAKKWEKGAFGNICYEFDTLFMDVWADKGKKEIRKIERLVISDDGSAYVELEDDREYYFAELDVNLIANMAIIIEQEYKEAIGKK